EGLEDRAAPHRRKLGLAWAVLAVPPAVLFGNVLLHASAPPSTWATGRGGFTLGISTLALWILFALGRMLVRKRTLAALGPVLATPRSLLAEASGTVELAVRARIRDAGAPEGRAGLVNHEARAPEGRAGLRALIGNDVVALSQVRIVERYGAG